MIYYYYDPHEDDAIINENDKIAVCISGGKDSFLLAKCMQELLRHGKFHYTLEFIVMNPGYSKENRLIIEDNARKLNIPIEIFETDIFENVFHIDKNPCYICARMRRGYLYNYAKEHDFLVKNKELMYLEVKKLEDVKTVEKVYVPVGQYSTINTPSRTANGLSTTKTK